MSARSVTIHEGGNVVPVLARGGGLVVIETAHARIHEGVLFGASHFVLSLASNADIEILIRIPALEHTHIALHVGCGGNAEVEFFEAPTSTADGSALARVNRNRLSANTATMLVFEGPTVTVDGTQLAVGFVPGGTGGNAIGGSLDTFGEWILDPNDYLVRLTNRAGAAQPAAVSLMWYEPPAV
jgi:hypothetical protein